DPSGIAALTLFYRTDPAAAFAPQPLRLLPSGLFAVTLPPAPAAARRVEYYFAARDYRGNESLLGGPERPFAVRLAEPTVGQRIRTSEYPIVLIGAAGVL